MIHQYGPIPVAICSYHTVFLYYGGGIITSADYSKPCIPDHAVLCVGFGTCPYTGLDYWLFKNSWGRGWGVCFNFIFKIILKKFYFIGGWIL